MEIENTVNQAVYQVEGNSTCSNSTICCLRTSTLHKKEAIKNKVRNDINAFVEKKEVTVMDRSGKNKVMQCWYELLI